MNPFYSISFILIDRQRIFLLLENQNVVSGNSNFLTVGVEFIFQQMASTLLLLLLMLLLLLVLLLLLLLLPFSD